MPFHLSIFGGVLLAVLYGFLPVGLRYLLFSLFLHCPFYAFEMGSCSKAIDLRMLTVDPAGLPHFCTIWQLVLLGGQSVHLQPVLILSLPFQFLVPLLSFCGLIIFSISSTTG